MIRGEDARFLEKKKRDWSLRRRREIRRGWEGERSDRAREKGRDRDREDVCVCT